MKVAFSVDGGVASFPGLRKPVTIDAAQLPAAHGERLRALVRRARFFDVAPPATPALADGRCYTIAVDDDGRCRTLTVPEPIVDAGLRALVAELSARAGELRQRGSA